MANTLEFGMIIGSMMTHILNHSVEPLKGSLLPLFHNFLVPHMTWNKTLTTQSFALVDVTRIPSLPLPPLPCDDHFVWITTYDGKFTVWKAYWLIVSFYARIKK